MPTLLTLLPLVVALIYAAAVDVRSRRIPNWLTLSLAAAGALQSFFPHALVSPLFSMAGMIVGFALPFAMFAMGALGGGDVKLFAAVGTWLGPIGVLIVFAAAAVAGLIIVCTQTLATGRFTTMVRNSAVLAVNIVHARELGVDHVNETAGKCRSVDKPSPMPCRFFSERSSRLPRWLPAKGWQHRADSRRPPAEGRKGTDMQASFQRVRRGNAILEAALVFPILLSLTFGCVEYGHYFYVKHTLQGAAREGVRAGITPSAVNSDVTTQIARSLYAAGLQTSQTVVDSSKFTVTISPSNVSTAAAGTQVQVNVTATWGTVGIRPLAMIGSAKQVIGASVMRKEG